MGKVFKEICMIYDEEIGMFKMDKPIYDSQDMIEKYISCDNQKVEVVSIENRTIESVNQRITFYEIESEGQMLLVSLWLIPLRNQTNDFYYFVLIDEGDYYWLEYTGGDDEEIEIDWDRGDFKELTIDWQW